MANNSGSVATSFLLLFRNAGPDAHAHLNVAERQELTERWNAWYEGLEKAGKVSTGAPLALEGRVVTGKRGEFVTDGPFAEAKEIVGGFVILTVENIEEATKIARTVPGLAVDLTVELRPIASVSPALTGVKGHI